MSRNGIPTEYGGVNFRSRLEARWACFFDAVGWRWEYEPLDLDGWIPDFLLHTRPLSTLVEIKPDAAIEHLHRYVPSSSSPSASTPATRCCSSAARLSRPG